MELSNLPKINRRGKKRQGQGIGSGKGGHTSGRGQKGQKARNKVPVYFMGAATGASLIKQLPYLRGKGKLKVHGNKPVVVNVKFLNLLPKGTIVTVDALIKNHIVVEEAKAYGVKVLGGGTLESAYTVALPVSGGARKEIEKAGGKITGQDMSENKETKDSKKQRAQRLKANPKV